MKLIFHHIPKTAGLSVRYVLRRYGNSGSLGSTCLHDNSCGWYHNKEEYIAEYQEHIKDASLDIGMGHVTHACLAGLWPEAKRFTILRDPILRYISAIHFSIRLGYCKSASEYIGNHNNHNIQTVFVESLDNFDFIATTKTLNTDMIAIAEYLGVEPLDIPVGNTSPGIRNFRIHCLDYIDDIINANLQDIELFGLIQPEYDHIKTIGQFTKPAV